MQTRRTFIQAAGGGALASLLPLAASAQALDQVKIYYGFPAGSAGDSVARRIGEKVAGSAYSRNVRWSTTARGPVGASRSRC